MKIICPNCGKELHTEHDLYYDMKTQEMGCVYCMKGLITEHVEWCDRWRKENIGREVEEQEQGSERYLYLRNEKSFLLFYCKKINKSVDKTQNMVYYVDIKKKKTIN